MSSLTNEETLARLLRIEHINDHLGVIMDCFSHTFYDPNTVDAQVTALLEMLSSSPSLVELDDVLAIVQWYGIEESKLDKYVSQEQKKVIKSVALLCYHRQNVQLFEKTTGDNFRIMHHVGQKLYHFFKSDAHARLSIVKSLSSFVFYAISPFLAVNSLWTFINVIVKSINRLHHQNVRTEDVRVTIPQVNWLLKNEIKEHPSLNTWYEITPIWIRLEQVRSVIGTLSRIVQERFSSFLVCDDSSCRSFSLLRVELMKNLLNHEERGL